MSVRTAAVVIAAGTGNRFGGDVRKQFADLGGEPVVVRTCRVFREHPSIDELVLVLPPETASRPPTWLRNRRLATRVVGGGNSRTESVRRGVAAVVPDAQVVLVHDGVRPLVSPELVQRVARRARHEPVIPVLPVSDTIKEVEADGSVRWTPDRSALRRAQTPQGFPALVLRDALARAASEGRRDTDEAALCERYGAPVGTVAGERWNVKITVPEDLELARWLLARLSGNGGTGGSVLP